MLELHKYWYRSTRAARPAEWICSGFLFVFANKKVKVLVEFVVNMSVKLVVKLAVKKCVKK